MTTKVYVPHHYRVLLGVILALLIAVCISDTAQAEEVLDQANNTQTGYYDVRNYVSQTFTVGTTGDLQRVELSGRMGLGGAGQNVGVLLTGTTESGEPDESEVLAAAITEVPFGEHPSINLVFDKSVHVNAGEGYALRVDGPTGTGPEGNPECFHWAIGDNNPYPAGGLYREELAGEPHGWYPAGEADAVFRTYVEPPPDTTAPYVTSVTPKAGSTGVSINVSPTAKFSENLQPSTVNTTAVKFKRYNATKKTWVAKPINVELRDGNTIILDPVDALTPASKYRSTINPGVKDLAGNSLVATQAWTFTTAR